MIVCVVGGATAAQQVWPKTVDWMFGEPVDASGTAPDGAKFNGPAELRRLLVRTPEQFATVVSEKLLIYALGRGLEYYDAPVIRQVVRGAAGTNYSFEALILGLVKSVPFNMRSSGSPAALADSRVKEIR